MRFLEAVQVRHSSCIWGDDRSASRKYGKRRERAERDRRLEELAIEVLTALGERDATITATEQRAGAALQAMITDESLTVSEAVQRCAGAISHREPARLRQLAAQAQNND
jgi:CHASE3 domain sensor protein